MSDAKIVTSTNETERVAKLKVAFLQQLETWLETMTVTVRHSPGAERALVEALIEIGIVAYLRSDLPEDEDKIQKIVFGLRDRVFALLDTARPS